jgi:CysZ protein
LLKEILISLQCYFSAHLFVKKHGSWKWIWVPGILYALLFGCGLYLFFSSSSAFTDYVMERTNIKEWLQSSNRILSLLFFTTIIMIEIVVLIYYFSLFKYLFLLLGAPVFSFISQKVQLIAGGDEVRVKRSIIINDTVRAARVVLKNLLFQTVYFLSLLLLCFIPVVGWVAPVIAVFVECYYYGFSMVDHACMRNDLAEMPAAAFIRHRRGLAVGNGMFFYIMHIVPVLGWIFAPAYAITSAILSLKKIDADN